MLKKLLALGFMFNAACAFGKPAKDEIVLNGKNAIIVKGEVTGAMASKFVVELAQRSEGVNPILVFIDSPGGSVMAMTTMVEAIKAHPLPVHCLAAGAASAAFVLLQACDHRMALPNAVIMQHNATYSVEGTAPQVKTFVRFIDDIVRSTDAAQAKRIGLTYEQFREKVQSDWWMTGVEAVGNKVVDEVVSARCSPEAAKGAYEETVQIFIFQVKLTFSTCPLASYPLKIGNDNETMRPDVTQYIGNVYQPFNRSQTEFIKLLNRTSNK